MLMEAAPAGLDVDGMGAAICAEEGVRSVHDLHVWTVTAGFGALAAHVVVARDCDRDLVRRRLELTLRERFGIEHTTLQMEEEADQAPAAGRERPRRRLIASPVAGVTEASQAGFGAWLASGRCARNRFVAVALSLAARGALHRCSSPAPALGRGSAGRTRSQAVEAGRGRRAQGRADLDDLPLRRRNRAASPARSPRSAPARPRSRLGSTPSRPSSTRPSPSSRPPRTGCVELRARLKRALVALRERLVAMYETGSPDMLSVIVGSGGVDDLAARAEYLDRLHGMDEAIVGRVRDLRDQVQQTWSTACAAPRTGSKPPATRSPPKSRRWPAPAPPLQSRQQQLVAARARARSGAGAGSASTRRSSHGDVAEIQGEIAAQLAATGSAPLPAGPIQGGSGGLIWPVNGAGRLRLRPALGLDARGRSTSPCRK